MSVLLSVNTTDGIIEIHDYRVRRLLLVMLRLMPQIEALERGKLSFSWSSVSPIKYSLEHNGSEQDLYGTEQDH
jgi:hypothetical protein